MTDIQIPPEIGNVPIVPVANAFDEVPNPKSQAEEVRCQVLIVGAGFSGISAIYRLRKAGFDVKCWESGNDFGGVWYWNRYPGARVDSNAPFYQLDIPELYETFAFAERFSDHHELRRYMAHADATLQLRKDTTFNARVNSCVWDKKTSEWTVRTQQGHVARCKYLLLTSGYLHTKHIPDFPGLSTYKGQVLHSAAWDEDFSAVGKKVALIGAGATGVQVTQELGKTAKQLTVFVRRPSYCIPMQQRTLSPEEQEQMRPYIPILFQAGRRSRTGFPSAHNPRGAFDVTEQERLAHWEKAWKIGGFQFGLTQFTDVSLNPDANKLAYDFWAGKVRERLTDPEKHRIMAPVKAPYYFSTRRHPLEQDYYDVLNRENVKIHDLTAVPLKQFVPEGIMTEDEKVYEVDAVALATGFDAGGSSLLHMGIRGVGGLSLNEYWKDGIYTHLGFTVPHFPNLFVTYGPQTPAVLTNGTAFIDSQVDVIKDMIVKLEAENVKSFNPRHEAAGTYKASLEAAAQRTLIAGTDSWWNGANIPGKKKEVMMYMRGMDTYEKECRDAIEEWTGFDVVMT